LKLTTNAAARKARWFVSRHFFPQTLLSVTADSGFIFRAQAHERILRQIAKTGIHEPKITNWLMDFLANRAGPGLFLDVGANFGWYAIHAAASANVETVVAFEAESFNAWLLDQNVGLNHLENVVVAPWAVGDRSGCFRLYRNSPSHRGRHTLVRDRGHGSSLVPMMELDRSLEILKLDDRPIHVMKIDVEGYEVPVTRCGQAALSRTAAVILEISHDLMEPAGYTVDELFDRIGSSGLTAHAFGTDGRLEPADLKGFQKAGIQTHLIWLRTS
jgi:FkbM family methyltransferase